MKIERILKGVKNNVKLSRYTTFKIGGVAKHFFVAKSKKDLIEAIKAAKGENLPFLILGEGSNILVGDKGYKGLVIKCRMSNVRLQKNKIYSEAGTKLKSLVKLSLKNSLTGLEWAVGIPGTIGGAVYGNAAAFWNSTANITEKIEVFDSKLLKIKKLNRKDCRFSNKDSIFKHKKNLVILSMVLKLKKRRRKEIQRKINEYLNYRKINHPLSFPSAGCVFKNYTQKIKNKKLLGKFPELKEFNKGRRTPTAYLIDKCGLKGKKIGKAKISEKHPNFIVNLGGAKAKDVKRLMILIKQKVKRKFGIKLEEEIQLIGF